VVRDKAIVYVEVVKEIVKEVEVVKYIEHTQKEKEQGVANVTGMSVLVGLLYLYARSLLSYTRSLCLDARSLLFLSCLYASSF